MARLQIKLIKVQQNHFALQPRVLLQPPQCLSSMMHFTKVTKISDLVALLSCSLVVIIFLFLLFIKPRVQLFFFIFSLFFLSSRCIVIFGGVLCDIQLLQGDCASEDTHTSIKTRKTKQNEETGPPIVY